MKKIRKKKSCLGCEKMRKKNIDFFFLFLNCAKSLRAELIKELCLGYVQIIVF